MIKQDESGGTPIFLLVEGLAGGLSAVARELLLFAACLIVMIGAEEVLVDLIWAVRRLWRRATVYRRHRPISLVDLPPPERPGWMAVFVPAWREERVIGAMLGTALSRLDHAQFRILVGCYPNDPATIAAVCAIAQKDKRVILVMNPRAGPTSKADNLNALWHGLCALETAGAGPAKAVVLHDAEDIVAAGELRLFDRLIESHDLVQVPVQPLIHPHSRWVSAHYADEFAEAHGKALEVREAVGAAMPSAGVGCALSRRVLERLAAERGGSPFAHDSLTEDYEIGLAIKGGIFVRMPVRPGGAALCVRAYFPTQFNAAVQQKSRWITGIALAGWDRLGWHGGIAENWMRLRDRKALLAALVILSAYLGLVLSVALILLGWCGVGSPMPPLRPVWLLPLAGGVLAWRALFRMTFVARLYGWAEGLRALPRMVTGNIIAMAAARRALGRYLAARRSGMADWGKTTHDFPQTLPPE